MSNRIADLFADLSLRTTKFSEGLNKAVSESKGASAKLTKLLGDDTASAAQRAQRAIQRAGTTTQVVSERTAKKVDEVVQRLAAASTQSKQTGKSIKQAMGAETQKGLRQAERAAAELNETVGKKLSKSVKNTEKDFEQMARNTRGWMKETSRIVMGILISQAFYSVLRQIKDASRALVEFTWDMEEAAVSFDMMLGSAERTEHFVASLEEFAAKTPFEFGDAQRGARRLMALGFAAENTIPIMRTLTDAAAMSGSVNPQTLDRMVTALGQIRTKGRLAQQELNQLTEAMIPANEIIREELGLTEEQMQNIGNVGISADVAIKALLRGIERRYKGAADKISLTTRGLFSTLKDNLLFMGRDILKGPAERFRLYLVGLVKRIDELRTTAKQLGTGGLFNALIPPGAQQSVRNVLGSIKSLAGSLKILGEALAPVIKYLGTLLLKALAVLLPALAGAARVIAHLTKAVTHSTGPLSLMAKALAGLLVAGVATAAVLQLANAFRVLLIAKLAAGALMMVSKALRVLTLAMTKNPVIAVAMMVAAALLSIAASSKTVSQWLDNVMNKISNLMGMSPSVVAGIDSEQQEMNDEFNQSLVDMEENLQAVAANAKKAGKNINDTFIASFDEVHQIPEQLAGAEEVLEDFKMPSMPDMRLDDLGMPNFTPIRSPGEEEDSSPVGPPINTKPPGPIQIKWGDPPIEPPPPAVLAALNTVAQQVKEFVKESKKNLEWWRTQLGTLVATGVGLAGQAVKNWAVETGKSISDWSRDTQKEIKNWGNEVGTRLEHGFATIKTATGTVLTTLVTMWLGWSVSVNQTVAQLKTNVLQIFSNWGSNAKNLVSNILDTLAGFWKAHKATIILIVTGLVLAIIIWFAGIPTAVGAALASLVLIVTNIFVNTKVAVAAEIGETKENVVSGWQSIRDSISAIATAIKDKVTTAFNTMKANVKGVINSLIQMMNKFIDGFNSIKITIPTVKIPLGPTLGGYTIGMPQIPRIPELKNGGVITRDMLYRGAEGNRPEAVVPLTGEAARPFANMIAQQIAVAGAPGGGDFIVQAGVLVADQLGLKELERRLRNIRASEDQRIYGQRTIRRGAG